jgi:magnesium chelatase subunit D
MTFARHADATWVAGLLALAGPMFGGALVAEDVSHAFLAAYTKAAGPEATLRSLPSSLAAETLTGSLDLAVTLALGKPVQTEGLLSAARPAQLLIRRAEALEPATAALLAQAMDDQRLMLLAAINPHDEEAVLSPQLEQRLPFRVGDAAEAIWTPEQIKAARAHLTSELPSKLLNDLCAAALAIGISSPRAVVQAVAVARAIAALQKQATVTEEAMALAARLVLAHRAQHAPPEDQPQQEEAHPDTPPPESEAPEDNTATPPTPADAEVILQAVKAALPAHLLQLADAGLGKRGQARNVKAAAARKASGQRGRRIGHKRAATLAGQRLDVLATLRSAAPWQPLRRKQGGTPRMIVTRDDFRVARIKQRNEATAIFAVDASGSTAFQRLAEAKGAVETILSECYVRRDRVALVAFRSKKAEVLLPPTRSLERAKRVLAGLPGGGGTPLAAGLDEAFALALQVRRAGGTPIVILLTDGRGNVTRAGEGNKVQALEEAQSAARLFAAQGFDAMLIDVSPEPQKSARALAAALQARYLPMPRASAADLARPIGQALQALSA